MCTSITYQMSDDINFLARTIDFGFELEGAPTIFPRQYPFPHEFISWVLGEIGSVIELKQRINEVSIMESENSLLEIVLPLHFIVTDSTGEVVVVEPKAGQLEIKNNPVKVMTNSPEFEWHLKNLNNYLGTQPNNFHKKYFGTHPILPFGQGSGTFCLPGGYTSPERFIRAAYLREYTP